MKTIFIIGCIATVLLVLNVVVCFLFIVGEILTLVPSFQSFSWLSNSRFRSSKCFGGFVLQLLVGIWYIVAFRSTTWIQDSWVCEGTINTPNPGTSGALWIASMLVCFGGGCFVLLEDHSKWFVHWLQNHSHRTNNQHEMQ